MSEGRNELEKAIEVWERRHAAAVRAKREAEVVMPFLRAAVEELDSFNANDGAVAVTEPVRRAPQAPQFAPIAAATPEPAPFSVGFASADATETEANETEAPTEFPHSFQRRAIASLMDDEDDDAEVAAR
jgi:hypothetical protein